MADKQFDRRHFFRRGLGELLGPLAKALDPVTKTLDELAKLDTPSPTPVSVKPRTVPLQLWLRPPGSGKEKEFEDKCSKCGICVTVCPARCIKLDFDAVAGNGLPYIDADSAACAVCESLACMKECPTGALVFTPTIDIDMGTAVWQEHLCVRTTAGETCTKCADICPMGSAAIELRGNEVRVMPLGCVGCGMCQQVCPTNPKSITVIPKAARE